MTTMIALREKFEAAREWLTRQGWRVEWAEPRTPYEEAFGVVSLYRDTANGGEFILCLANRLMDFAVSQGWPA